MNMNNKVKQLFSEQMAEWKLAHDNFCDLSLVRTKVFSFERFNVKVQFNPARITSVRAKTDEKSIAERKCFLCAENRPPEQTGIEYGDYIILVNPYPILPVHFTIPRKEHTPQRIKPYFNDLLLLARDLSDYVVFYNGPQSGASAPDHMHFQSGTKHFLPLVTDYPKIKNSHSQLIEKNEHSGLYILNNYLRTVFCIESDDITSAGQMFDKLYDSLLSDDVNEPMMNVVCIFEEGKWFVFVLPRKASRPWQFYSEDEEKRLLVSPGTVEVSGLFITPVLEHFEKITKEDIVSIYEQVSRRANL